MNKVLKNRIFRFFASLKLAVITLLSLALLLAIATVVEAEYGMRASYLLVYGTGWFSLVLTFLGINVFCAALSRYPWKKRQIGFLTTHFGILTILFGSFLTQQIGVDANLAVTEGTSQNAATLSHLVLWIKEASSQLQERIEIPEFAFPKKGKLLTLQLGKDKELSIEEFIPRARVERKWEKSPLPKMGMPALRIALFNSRFTVEEWLYSSHPEKPLELELGPATLVLQKLWTEEEEFRFLHPATLQASDRKGRIIANFQGREFTFSAQVALNHWIPFPHTDFEVKIEKIFPYAAVENRELVNIGEEWKNPAATLLVRHKKEDRMERHTIFTLFPEFSTLHKKSKKRQEDLEFGIQWKFLANTSVQKMRQSPRGKLYLAQTRKEKLLYRVEKTGGQITGQGEISLGEIKTTGWMDLKFQIKEWIPYAIETISPEYIEGRAGKEGFGAAIQLSFSSHSTSSPQKETKKFWLIEGVTRGIATAENYFYVSLSKDKISLPFSIFLHQFHMGVNPGTQKAASYESTVQVINEKSTPLSSSTQISMNEPLTFGGYTFYQASYQKEEGRPTISIFSVNRDPGRMVKYFGSLIMCLGIIFMFYLNPHYWGKIIGKKNN